MEYRIELRVNGKPFLSYITPSPTPPNEIKEGEIYINEVSIDEVKEAARQMICELYNWCNNTSPEFFISTVSVIKPITPEFNKEEVCETMNDLSAVIYEREAIDDEVCQKIGGDNTLDMSQKENNILIVTQKCYIETPKFIISKNDCKS